MVDVQVTFINEDLQPASTALFTLVFKWHGLQSVEGGQTSVRSAAMITKGIKASH